MLHDALILQTQGHLSEPADFTHPGDIIDSPVKEMIPVEEALQAICFIICEIRGADSARMSVDCLAGAVGLLTYENRSMADIARTYGKSREAIRKRVEILQRGIGLNIIGATFQKRSQVGSEYNLCNRRNYKG